MGVSYRLDPWDQRYLADALARSVASEATNTKRGPTKGMYRDAYPGQSLVNALTDYVPVIGDIKAGAAGGEMAANGHPIRGLATALAGAVLPAAGRRVGEALGAGERAALAEALNPYAHLPEPPRMYHGTSAAFNEFDPSRLDNEALYGPGYYFTDNPKIAGGAVDEIPVFSGPFGDEAKAREWLDKPSVGSPAIRSEVRPSHDGFEVVEYYPKVTRGYAHKGGPSHDMSREDLVASLARAKAANDPRWVANMEEAIAQLDAFAPNVRPARVALANPFDINKTYTPDEIRALADRTTDPTHASILRSVADYSGRNGYRGPVSGDWMYDELGMMGVDSKAERNSILRSAGFDGITHLGGINSDVQHDVRIAFDRDQIRSPWGDWKDAARVGGLAAVLAGAGAAQKKREQR